MSLANGGFRQVATTHRLVLVSPDCDLTVWELRGLATAERKDKTDRRLAWLAVTPMTGRTTQALGGRRHLKDVAAVVKRGRSSGVARPTSGQKRRLGIVGLRAGGT